MRRYLFLGVFLFLSLGLNGQFGLRINYVNSSAPNWELIQGNNVTMLSPVSLYQDGLKIGLDYWTRLPQKRVEFYPEIAFSRFKSTAFDANSQTINYEGQSLGIHLNTHFYLLDFQGDCDCPTFSKKGNLFKKGFFLSAHGGAQWHSKNITNSETTNASMSPVLGVGLGLDVGLNDLITVTPFIQYQVAFGDKWESLASTHGRINLAEFETTSFRQFHFGFRIGLRPDYK